MEVKMPQNTVLPQWQAEYPILAPVQKPSGVTVATTATPPRVPNKPTYATGTIQMVQADSPVEEIKADKHVADHDHHHKTKK
jgi:hypothetical protein